MGLSIRETIWVRCYRGDSLLRSYDFGWPESLNPAADTRPSGQGLENEAKTNLTTEGLAWPPYDGMKFVIEYPR
jgi:hypothetical protein